MVFDTHKSQQKGVVGQKYDTSALIGRHQAQCMRFYFAEMAS